MAGDENIEIIRRVYDAFGRDDIDAVMAVVADDVDWATEAASTVAPWWGVRHGKREVAQFFEDYGSAMAVEEFSPIAFAANATEVLTVVHCRAVSRATGKAVVHDLHHFFRFEDGKIAFHRATEDTAQIEAALRNTDG
jgi:ketosteroid isomerase-like protein